MTRKEHIQTHKGLHRILDLLVADFIATTERLPSETSVMELMSWSHKQTENPELPTGQTHKE